MYQSIASTCAVIVALWVAQPAIAADEDQIDALFDALKMSEITQIMQEEGAVFSATIADDLFPERTDTGWAATVQRIYDLDAMTTKVRADFGAALKDRNIDAIAEFFGTEHGASFVELEVSARRAMLDEAIKTASEDAAAIAMQDRGPRFQLIAQFIETSDLIEPNVVGALNSNYAFYNGLMDGGYFDAGLSEDQILSDVWGQEPDIRANTTEWLYAFLLLAYAPMSDDDLETYIAFSATDAGQLLNTALFAAFSDMFDAISYQLGRAAADVASATQL